MKTLIKAILSILAFQFLSLPLKAQPVDVQLIIDFCNRHHPGLPLKQSQEHILKKLYAEYLLKNNIQQFLLSLQNEIKPHGKGFLGRHYKTIEDLSKRTSFNIFDEAKRDKGLDFNPKPRNDLKHKAMKKNYMLVTEETLWANDLGYISLKNTHIKSSDLGVDASIKGSFKVIDTAIAPCQSNNTKTRIVTTDQDTFVAAEELVSKGLKTAVLNFANARKVGGGFLHGAAAQEEDLCRRSTLFNVLSALNKNGLYPMLQNETIYSPNITVFRAPYFNYYDFLDQPFQIDIITQAAPCLKYPKPQNYQQLMLDKIRAQLRLAALNGNKAVVLGAFGCGAFRNDPQEVSSLYDQVLKENEFQNVFEEIRFAIPDKKSNNHIHFKNIFKKQKSIILAKNACFEDPIFVRITSSTNNKLLNGHWYYGPFEYDISSLEEDKYTIYSKEKNGEEHNVILVIDSKLPKGYILYEVKNNEIRIQWFVSPIHLTVITAEEKIIFNAWCYGNDANFTQLPIGNNIIKIAESGKEPQPIEINIS